MKKITFFYAICCFAFTWQGMAQTLNEPANWPNASWTVTGTFNADPTAFEADPTTTSNFAFDDDDAGSGHEDNIAAESPVIDLTAAFTASETWLTVSFDYVYNYFSSNERFALEYYDADAGSWTEWQIIATSDTPGAPNDNFCSGTPVGFVSDVLDISGFTSTQLLNFQYRIFFDDNINGAGWVYGFCVHSPTITSSAPPTDVLDYYNLQWPATGNIVLGGTFDVYAQCYEAGLTDVTSGQSPGIECWIGYSTADTDPSSAGWTWVAANFFGENGNNDEYMLNLGASMSSLGTFYYASRWRFNGGVYTYGGIQANGTYGGVWGEDNNISGVLTISGPANDECVDAEPISCGATVTGSTTGATNSGGNSANDVWYVLSGTVPGQEFTVSLCGSSYDTYLRLYSQCNGTQVAANDDSCGTQSQLTFVSAGGDYYIMVEGFSSNNGNFILAITCAEPPECTQASASTSVDLDCEASQFSVEVDITDLGDATHISDGTDTWPVSGTGIVEVGPFDFGSTVNLTLVHSDPVCNLALGSFSYLACPPVNDLFADAIALNCGDDVTGTTIGATHDEADAPSVTTVEPDTLADNDSPWVWYSYTGSGVEERITLSTCGADQTDFDTELFVYIGTSGNLTLIDDGYDECGGSSENFAAETSFTSDGTTTYYIAVGGWNASSVGNFHLAVSCETLSVNNMEQTAFTYYPNPVENILTLNAQSNIENVSVFNMLGQEVLRTSPNAMNSDLDMASLQTGHYFVKVTIADKTETIRIIKE